MIVFNINHTDYTLLLKDLAAEFGILFTGDDYVDLPDSAGKGYIKILKLFDELQVLVADVTFKETLVTSREHSDSRYFILHFDDVNITTTAKLKVDGETLLKQTPAMP
jgi:hypothetical protein